MNNLLKKTKSLFGALILAGVCQAGQAAVVYEETGFITGSDFFTDTFDIVTQGTYRATLTDLEFPEPFETLGLAVTSSTENFGDLIGAGTFTFDATPGTYFANLFATANPVFDLGLYGVKVELIDESVSYIPIPAPVLLFVSGLAAIAAVRRRKTVNAVVAA